jgi:hypothetical protein
MPCPESEPFTRTHAGRAGTSRECVEFDLAFTLQVPRGTGATLASQYVGTTVALGTMSRRRTRSTPTVTELARIERVLEADPALRARLGTKTSPERKRNGEVVHFAPEVVAVAVELIARPLNPERLPVRKVLSVAAEVLGIGTENPDAEPGS